jgi:hypothetical protein
MSLGAFSGIFVVAPSRRHEPLGANPSPAGTLYTTSALSTAPQSATWSTTAPAALSSVTRVAINTAHARGQRHMQHERSHDPDDHHANATTPIYGIVTLSPTTRERRCHGSIGRLHRGQRRRQRQL